VAAVGLEQRIAALEAKLQDAEKDIEWDALEPELRTLRADVYEAVKADEAALGGARSSYAKQFGWWDYVNPFDASARDRYKSTVSRKQFELEQEKGLSHRLAAITARFYADKTRAFARELIRIAEKVQREVHGSWSLKAGAAFGGAVTEVGGDAAIERAKAVTKALGGRYVDEACTVAAAILSGMAADRAAEALDELSDALGRDELTGKILGAALLSGRPDAVPFVRDFRRKTGGRAYDADAILLGAALLSKLDVDAAYDRLVELERVMPGSPEQKARLASAALIAGLDGPTAKRRAEAFIEEIGGDPESAATIASALLLAGADSAGEAKLLRSATRGTIEAEGTLVAAGILANRPIDEAVAFIAHVQQALTGTWESEAFVIAGGILAGDRSDAIAKASFVIPGLFASTGD
jgi:hypothetical protein